MITLLNKFDDHYIIKEQDIIDIASSYIKANNLEGYLSDVIFDNNSKRLGNYNMRTKEIVLNDEKVIKLGYRLFDKLQEKYQLGEDYYTYFLNFYYLYIIYHELTHVSRRAKYENNLGKEINMFNYLYELCAKLHHKDLFFYKNKENHDLFPMEIDANNNGFLIAYNLMNYTKLPSKEVKVMQLQYLFSLKMNYEKISNFKITAPIEILADKNPNVNLYEIYDIARQTDLSRLERMNLGLPITPKEYEEVVKEEQKLLIKSQMK